MVGDAVMLEGASCVGWIPAFAGMTSGVSWVSQERLVLTPEYSVVGWGWSRVFVGEEVVFVGVDALLKVVVVEIALLAAAT